jgi:hypothetical protein
VEEYSEESRGPQRAVELMMMMSLVVDRRYKGAYCLHHHGDVTAKIILRFVITCTSVIKLLPVMIARGCVGAFSPERHWQY